MHDERVVRWPALGFENPGNCIGRKCIRCQAVNRFGWNGHKLPLAKQFYRLAKRSGIFCVPDFRVERITHGSFSPGALL